MTTTDAEKRSRPRNRRVWIHVALALLLTLVVIASVGQPSSTSMSPTLERGDRILINRLAYVGADPGQGDIVVFRPDASWGERPPTSSNPIVEAVRQAGDVTGIRPFVLVKRVIAGPGQTVECCDADGSVVVDGEALPEPYLVDDLPFVPGEVDCDSTPRSERCFTQVTVPDDSYLVLGDNRANSADSAFRCRGQGAADAECWRWVRKGDVIGKAFLVFWPLSRWATL